MQAVLHFDDVNGSITIEGGATYTTINNFLQDKKWAVKNLATLPHFTVAGSISMGTHGSSGVGPDGRAKLGNQASQVSGIDFVLPDGSLKAYSRKEDPATFDGVVVALGCLGPIASITLDLTPRFNVVQAVYIDITVESVIDHFRDMVNSVDSFSWLVDWPRGEENADMSALQGVVRSVRNLPPRSFTASCLVAVTHPLEHARSLGAIDCLSARLSRLKQHLHQNFHRSAGVEVRLAGIPFARLHAPFFFHTACLLSALYDPETMGAAIQSSGLVCGPWYDLMNTYGAGLPSGRGAQEDQSAYGLNGGPSVALYQAVFCAFTASQLGLREHRLTWRVVGARARLQAPTRAGRCRLSISCRWLTPRPRCRYAPMSVGSGRTMCSSSPSCVW